MATHRESGQNALGHFRERSDSMTDITELAQRARINAECGEHLSPAETMELVEALESEKRICATWRKTAKSTGEKLEKAQTINAAAEKLVRCKGRYHSEQNYRALAALFGVNTPDLPPLEHENVHYADAAEMEIEALRQRIAELEESNAQVIQSRDHYKRMTEEGLKQLAEARTVKLPDLRQIVSGDRYVWSDGVYNYSQDVKVVLAAAGIKVEVE
ncbi:ead/Ea22-like family protein [Klebsiella pneumoniae]|uniref:ead/Ea22-like family protein n=1 Tax=Klebsiella pneumoniae TaxID=573 RepID=UPI001CC6C911|nr:ead/Ea22-like family protein [Klebsiella pneumoniae]MDL4710284.1 ead/Ea22-like family protein [Klebsiella pneumoniae]